ncbi:hypothetical protein FSP39_007471 [Pinctada imbricata]|uniref:Uncharacterized protein n=1 Tax=Pinctada imbricata TaxID=66713 RepID=A0AA88XGH8_PINIB|nr:hypothetical protein FSP39_007471 [Pinctada imbricata]
MTDENFKTDDEKVNIHTGCDLDIFCESFDKWQTLTVELSSKNCEFTEKIERLEKQKNEDLARIYELNAENMRLRDSLKQVNKRLDYICDLEEELRKKKGILKEKEDEIASMEKNVEGLKVNHESEKRSLLEKQNIERIQTEKDMKDRHEEELNILREQLCRKDLEIGELEKRFHEKEEEVRKESMKISMEYEDRISKLKQKIATATSKAHGSSNQDIYRMKLQNMKLEYENTIRQLHQTIADLEGRLTNQNRVSASAIGASSGRKRKY